MPLHAAAFSGHTETALALVALGANINAAIADGATPAVIAGATPAAVAAICGHPATAEALVALGATPPAASPQTPAADSKPQ
jgi:ankyrin repeat protein